MLSVVPLVFCSFKSNLKIHIFLFLLVNSKGFARCHIYYERDGGEGETERLRSKAESARDRLDRFRTLTERFILVDESYRVRFFNPNNVNMRPLRCLRTERFSRCVIFAGPKAVAVSIKHGLRTTDCGLGIK